MLFTIASASMNAMDFIKNLGPIELLIIGFVLLMLFGKRKIHEWAKGLGESGRELNKAKKELTSALQPETTPEKKHASS